MSGLRGKRHWSLRGHEACATLHEVTALLTFLRKWTLLFKYFNYRSSLPIWSNWKCHTSAQRVILAPNGFCVTSPAARWQQWWSSLGPAGAHRQAVAAPTWNNPWHQGRDALLGLTWSPEQLPRPPNPTGFGLPWSPPYPEQKLHWPKRVSTQLSSKPNKHFITPHSAQRRECGWEQEPFIWHLLQGTHSAARQSL